MAAAPAQSDYPSRPIRFIVGFGAGGRIAADYVAHQPADGNKVLVGATGQIAIATAVFANLNYHGIKSFTPLNMIASFPPMPVVPANHPVKSVKELVAWAKASPDEANYGDLVAGLHHRRGTAQAEVRCGAVSSFRPARPTRS